MGCNVELFQRIKRMKILQNTQGLQGYHTLVRDLQGYRLSCKAEGTRRMRPVMDMVVLALSWQCKRAQKHRAIRETCRRARFLIAHGVPRVLVGGFPTAMRSSQIIHSPRLGRTTGPHQALRVRSSNPFLHKRLRSSVV